MVTSQAIIDKIKTLQSIMITDDFFENNNDDDGINWQKRLRSSTRANIQ
jgi:hypothetical protein